MDNAYDWEKVKEKAIKGLPSSVHNFVSERSLSAEIVALNSLIKGESPKSGIQDFISEAKEAIERWDMRNAPMLILAFRKEGIYIVPKNFDLSYELDFYMAETEDSPWVFSRSDTPVSDMAISQRNNLLNEGYSLAHFTAKEKM